MFGMSRLNICWLSDMIFYGLVGKWFQFRPWIRLLGILAVLSRITDAISAVTSELTGCLAQIRLMEGQFHNSIAAQSAFMPHSAVQSVWQGTWPNVPYLSKEFQFIWRATTKRTLCVQYCTNLYQLQKHCITNSTITDKRKYENMRVIQASAHCSEYPRNATKKCRLLWSQYILLYGRQCLNSIYIYSTCHSDSFLLSCI